MAIKPTTLAHMHRLHQIVLECGAMSVSDAVLIGGFHKNSCQEWMARLVEIGCVMHTVSPGKKGTRNNARYYEATAKPFPAGDLPALKPSRVTGVHEFSRIVRPAVNMGMVRRDPLMISLYGEKA